MTAVSSFITDEAAKRYLLDHNRSEKVSREERLKRFTEGWELEAQDLIDLAGSYRDRRRVKATSLERWSRDRLCWLYLFHGDSWLIRFKADLEAAGLSQVASAEIGRNIKREAPNVLQELKESMVSGLQIKEDRKNGGVIPSVRKPRENHKCLTPDCGRGGPHTGTGCDPHRGIGGEYWEEYNNE